MDGTTITENQRSALHSLKPAADNGFYLAGGTALCLKLGHRRSKEHPDLLHRLKALTYFDDAEREPEPLLLRPASWQTVRDFFEQQVRDWWLEGGS